MTNTVAIFIINLLIHTITKPHVISGIIFALRDELNKQSKTELKIQYSLIMLADNALFSYRFMMISEC